ncbi:MAG: O-antigen ligase family protein [Chitinophagaceae bacterium]
MKNLIPTDIKKITGKSFPYLLILIFYLTVDFVPIGGSLDIIGPQWFYCSFLNLISLAYLWFFKKSTIKENHAQGLRSPIPIFYFLYSLFAGISIFFAINAVEGFVVYARLITTFISFLIFLHLFKQKEEFFPILAQIITLILIYQCFEELKTFFTGISEVGIDQSILRMQAGMGNKNIFAASIIIKLPFVFFCISNTKIILKIFNACILLVAIYTLFLVNARASFIGLLVESFIYLLFLSTKFITQKNWRIFLKESCLFIVPVIIALVMSQFTLKEAKETFEVATNNYGTAFDRLLSIDLKTEEGTGNRLHLYKIAKDIIKKNPLTGVGIGNWKLASIPYERNTNIDVVVNYHPHNDLLETMGEIGLTGGLCYLAIFITVGIAGALLILRKKKNLEKIVFPLMAIAGYFVDASLNFPMERTTMQVYLVFWLALFTTSTSSLKEIEKKLSPFLYKIAYGFCFLSCIASCYINGQTYLSMIVQRKVYSYCYLYPGNGKQSWKEINNKFPCIPNLTQTTLPVNELKVELLMLDKRYEQALILLNSSPSSNPFIGYHEYLKSILFRETGNTDSALVYAQRAFYLRPLNLSHYQLLAGLAIKNNDTALLENTFRVFQNKRNDPTAWNTYWNGLYNLGADKKKLTELADKAAEIFPENSLILEIKRKSYELELKNKQ